MNRLIRSACTPRLSFLFLALALLAPQTATAAVLFTNDTFPTPGSARTGASADLLVPHSNHTPYQYFTLSGGSQTIRSVSFYGLYYSSVTADDFNMMVYSSEGDPSSFAGAMPDAHVADASILQVDRQLTPHTASGFQVYKYTAYLADLPLAGGAYWLGINNSSGGGWSRLIESRFILPLQVDAVVDMFTTGDPNQFSHYNQPSTFRDTSWLPMTISNDIHNVPEPSTCALAALGAIGLITIRRRASRR